MSTLRVNTLQNTSTTDGGISIDTSGHVTVDGVAMPSAGPLSNRNLVINGAMQVAQRGTSVSVSDGTNEGYQTLDRFAFYFSSSAEGAATISQSTTVPSGEGFSNSYKVDVTTTNTPSGTETILIRHRIEAQDLANSGWNYTSTSSNISISFWARSTKAGTYCLRLQLADTSTDKYYIAEYTLSADTWKRVEITVPGHSNAVINNDNDVGFEFEWILASNDTSGTAGSWSSSSARATTNQVNVFDSTDGEFYLTGVQLEVGSVATPFEHRSYGQELSLCQRYYYKTQGNAGTVPGFPFTTYSSGAGVVNVRFPVTMRVAPSFNWSGTARIQAATDSANFTSGLSIFGANTDGTGLLLGGTTNMTTNASGHFQMRASNTYLEFSAEL